MTVKITTIQHKFRNKYIKYAIGGGGTSTKLNDSGGECKFDNYFYEDEDGNLHSKLSFVGDKEIAAYGAGESGESGTIAIIDNLTSTQTDCALSANQGRILKSLIDGKVSTWDDLEGKPNWIGSTKPSYSWNEITSKPSTFTPSSHTHLISNITGLQSLLDGKASSSHTHNYVSAIKLGSTNYNVAGNVISLPAYPVIPSSLKNPYALTISLNGTSQGGYDGSASKSINITPSNIGAATSNHTHTISNITNLQSTLDSKLNSSSYTANDVLTKLKTVDGNNSGLDADLLDGVHLIQKGSTAGVMRSWARGTHTTVNQYFGNGVVVVIDPKPTDSNDLWANTTIFSVGDSSVRNWQMAFGYGADVIKVRKNNDGWGSWKTLAFLDSNVASASKLQTARNIWGQSFNGTKDISGELTGVTNITASGEINLNGIRLSKNNNFFNISTDTQITGNLQVTGEITAYAGDGVYTSFLYNPSSFANYSANTTNQVPTVAAVKLFKDQIVAESLKTTLLTNRVNSLITTITNSFSTISTSSNILEVTQALMKLRNSLILI